MALAACHDETSILSAPPGLEEFKREKAFDDMMPAKVQLPKDMFPLGLSATDEALSSSGAWVNAVSKVVPYLNAEGGRRALEILDRAIVNAQHAKALDASIAQTRKPGPATTPYTMYMASCMRMQVQAEQQVLLSELHQLRYGGSAYASAATDQEDPLGFQALLTAGLAGPPSLGCIGAGEDAPPSLIQVDLISKDRGAQSNLASLAKANATAQRCDQRVGGRQVSAPQTLSSSLQLLSGEDADCLFIVRRINKLGFKASRTLKRHFGDYGQVVRVLVAHSTVRQSGDPQQSQSRRRPSSLGFVQMAAADAVAKILAVGEDHCIEGSMIRVQRFERKQVELEEEEEEAAVSGDKSDEFGWTRNVSEASTRTASTSGSSSSSSSRNEA